MPRPLIILSYKRASRALRRIREQLVHEGIEIHKFLYPGAEDWEALVVPKKALIFNWGWGHDAPIAEYINPPHIVAQSVNKLSTYTALVAAGMDDCLPFATPSRARALREMEDGTCTKWVCRTKLEGKDGQGIIISDDAGNLPNAKLYVEYKECPREFRVHVHVHDKDASAFVTEKVWDTDEHPDDLRVGTTFMMGAVDHTSKPVIQCKEAAIIAVESLGLDFAGVDVGWDGERPWVFETNTAPGMFGPQTTKFYVDLIKSKL